MLYRLQLVCIPDPRAGNPPFTEVLKGTVRWSGEFLTDRVTAAVLRYLAVAHFGRGRGDFVAGEYPAHWGLRVTEAVASRATLLGSVWSDAARGDSAAAVELRLRAPPEAIVSEVLERLYPPGG